jgi:hypothetical protein
MTVLNHAFLDMVATLRTAFRQALLEHQSLEERLQVDILLGDMSWETSYSLPGEGTPPRVRADLSLDWPTWSQTALRSWALGDPGDEQPELGIELVLRMQSLANTPDVAAIAAVLPDQSPALGDESLVRSAPTVEHAFNPELGGEGFSVEFAYEGTYELSIAALEDRTLVERDLAGLAAWVASTLVRLGDLKMEFLPAEQADEDR